MYPFLYPSVKHIGFSLWDELTPIAPLSSLDMEEPSPIKRPSAFSHLPTASFHHRSLLVPIAVSDLFHPQVTFSAARL